MLLKCSKCDQEKDEEEFSINRRATIRNGRHYYCRKCASEATQQWSKDNPEKWKRNKKKYIENHIDKYREVRRLQAIERRKNPAVIERQSEYYQRNKESINEVNKLWRSKNIERTRETSRKYYEKNKERHMAVEIQRLHTDPLFALTKKMRSSFTAWIRGRQKTCSVMDLLGLSIKEFKQWIESQFQEGMSWDNRREWHIDHYAPLDYFDPTNQDDMKICWHYLNLRPLWAKDNMSKNNKLPSDYMEHIAKIKEVLTIR